MHEDQPGDRVGDTELAQRPGHRQQHHLEGDEAAHHQQAEQQVAAARNRHIVST